MGVPIKVHHCQTCRKIRNALPLPARTRRALEDLEERRIRAKEAKRARKEAKV
jgi:hypothetical protein